ncbi:universal stress protein [Microlunatus ginsengisoli]|uniref:UspA domain-containing protein n=1 Tax=Microlunatus ginsengisoli TaxID=363863 RepID=A0ABP7A3D0_9ACTN
MTILVAVPESPEGRYALGAAAAEAKSCATDLVVINLGLRRLDESILPRDVELTVIERSGPQRGPADSVLEYVAQNPAISRLVIGMKRRTPVGKAVFGSVSQRLLLESPVPVLAVKPESAA